MKNLWDDLYIWWEEARYQLREWWMSPHRIGVTCPECDGKGGYTDYIDYWIGGPWYECALCDGDGRLSFFRLLSYWFWTKWDPKWAWDLVNWWHEDVKKDWDKMDAKENRG